MHHHPIAARPAASTGFGFDEIMARPFENRFRRWYDAVSLLPAMPAAPAVPARRDAYDIPRAA